MEIKELVNNLSTTQIIDLMTSLGAERYQKVNNAIVFPTICHNINPNEASMKLYYYPKTKTFHCYTDCGETFNIIEMFKKRYELLNIDYNFYHDIVLKIGGKVDHSAKALQGFYKPYETLYKSENNNIEVNFSKLNKGLLNIYTFYPTVEWLSDGISVEAMKAFNILYSIEENKIIIPHYDVDNNLIGIRARALNQADIEKGKYMPVKIEGKTYAHPLGFNLYGLNVNKDNIKRMKMAIVAESEKSVLQYYTMFGKDNNIVVAACGSSFHKYQLDLLLACGAEKVLIAFDKEGETWEEKNKYYNKLANICKKYKNYATMGFLFDFKNLLSLKDSPFDKGIEIFKKMYSNAIWIK